MSVTLMSRLLLSLRETADNVLHVNPSLPSHGTPPTTRSIELSPLWERDPNHAGISAKPALYKTRTLNSHLPTPVRKNSRPR